MTDLERALDQLPKTDVLAVAVATSGREGYYRITTTYPATKAAVEHLARFVGRRKQYKAYYLIVVDKETRGERSRRVIARWQAADQAWVMP